MADPQVQALIAGDQGAFEQLVQGLMSSQNQSRQAAEALFNQMKEANGDACVTNLVALLRTSPQQDSRTLTAVLLRKVITGWPVLRCEHRRRLCLKRTTHKCRC